MQTTNDQQSEPAETLKTYRKFSARVYMICEHRKGDKDMRGQFIDNVDKKAIPADAVPWGIAKVASFITE